MNNNDPDFWNSLLKGLAMTEEDARLLRRVFFFAAGAFFFFALANYY